MKEKVKIAEEGKEIKIVVGDIMRNQLSNELDNKPTKTKETIKKELELEKLEWEKDLKKRDDYLTETINRLKNVTYEEDVKQIEKYINEEPITCEEPIIKNKKYYSIDMLWKMSIKELKETDDYSVLEKIFSEKCKLFT